MALLVDCTCETCGEKWQGMTSSSRPAPKECTECYDKRTDRQRREHFSGLDGLTLDERIRRVEEWIYDYRPPKTGPTVFG